MTDTELLHAAERVLDAFGDHASLSPEDVRSLLEGDDDLTTRCLGFLHSRDNVIVVAEGPTLFHRDRLTDLILSDLRDAPSRTPEEIAAALNVPVSVTCEILGWLEREGRVRPLHDGDTMRFTAV